MGWGAGTFALVYISSINNRYIISHAHNLFLELAYNYGVLLALTLSATIFFIILKSAKIIYSHKGFNLVNLVDRAWLSSAIIILLFHISDVTYYDGRISITMWILLSGLKTIIDNNKSSISFKEYK